MLDNDQIIEKMADPANFRNVILAIRRKWKIGKTPEEQKKLRREFKELGEKLAQRFLMHGEYMKALIIFNELSWKKYGVKIAN